MQVGIIKSYPSYKYYNQILLQNGDFQFLDTKHGEISQITYEIISTKLLSLQ